jgi:hypothetical protein
VFLKPSQHLRSDRLLRSARRKPVPCPDRHEETALHVYCLKFLKDLLAVLDRHDLVLVAMDQEDRCVIRRVVLLR